MTIEIRKDDAGKLEEIAASGVNFHMERMDGKSWFISIQTPDGDEHRFWFRNIKGRVDLSYSEVDRPTKSVTLKRKKAPASPYRSEK